MIVTAMAVEWVARHAKLLGFYAAGFAFAVPGLVFLGIHSIIRYVQGVVSAGDVCLVSAAGPRQPCVGCRPIAKFRPKDRSKLELPDPVPSMEHQMFTVGDVK